jgi:hypothetical protein
MLAFAKISQGENRHFVTLSDNIFLNCGDLIKFYFVLENEAFIYLFHEDSRTNFTLLFPKTTQSAKASRSTPVCIPEGNSWIELDLNPEKEIFHLIVSTEQIEKLQKLYNHHIIVEENHAKNKSVQDILFEIKSLKRMSLRAKAEKPQRISGKLRGNYIGDLNIPPEIEHAAFEIFADGVYVKSYTINHK